MDVGTYKVKEIEDGFKKTSVITSVALAVRGNHKHKLGSNWADAERCGLSDYELIKAHDVLDAKYLREVNRTLARTLYDAVFPGGSETIATTRLRSILKTLIAAKIIPGELVGGEDLATPLDPNVRLSKLGCPAVVDPRVHRKYRSIVGSISYLINLTRPDLAFSFSQLSKVLQALHQHPGKTYLAAGLRARDFESRHLLPRPRGWPPWQTQHSFEMGR